MIKILNNIMEFAQNFKHRVTSTVGGKGAVVPC